MPGSWGFIRLECFYPLSSSDSSSTGPHTVSAPPRPPFLGQVASPVFWQHPRPSSATAWLIQHLHLSLPVSSTHQWDARSSTAPYLSLSPQVPAQYLHIITLSNAELTWARKVLMEPLTVSLRKCGMIRAIREIANNTVCSFSSPKQSFQTKDLPSFSAGKSHHMSSVNQLDTMESFEKTKGVENGL